MARQFLVATRKGLFTFSRSQRGWEVSASAFLGDPVTMVLHEPRSDLLFAALDLGHFGVKLHRSTDRGSTWSEIAAPAYPRQADGETDLDPMRGEPVPWDLKRIWALESGRAQDGRLLWCGTIPGGLFRSEDAGESWQIVDALWRHPARREWFGGGADFPGIHSILVNPRQPDGVTVAVSCGGVWHSDDAGATWSARTEGMWAAYFPPGEREKPTVQDPHRVVQCVAEPDILWAQHHNGIFRSVDRGRHWSEIEAPAVSGFGFAVAVHPKDADTAWFVPAARDERRFALDGQVVVTRTRDGGRHFEVLREGLPQQHAYDLVYRHALDVDASGTRLAFASTTGSLWVSEDQGEAWQQLSAHLPPVYCLRFLH